MGQAISAIGHRWPFQPSKTGKTKSLWPRSRDLTDSNCHFSPAGFRVGIYHLVAGQAGRSSSAALAVEISQSRNNPPYPHSTWSSLSDRTNLVREPRPRLRGKKNAIIDLYRHPPKRGVVICFDELGPLQTIPRGGQQWGQRPARRPDRYSRNGTLQWFGAFCPTTGESVGQGAPHKNAESCGKFWKEVMLTYWQRGSIHLIMDNLSAHKKALRMLSYRFRRRIKVYWLPTNSSWLNLIESYFATLHKTALNNTDYKSPQEIEQGLLRGVKYLNLHPKPYIWKKI